MWESFWNAWVAPLPDVWTKEWFDGLRDVLSLALAALGARLAAMSIKVGRDNEKVTTRQVELMEGQKTLLLELKNLEAKQADAAVRQEAIASRQRLLGVGCRIVLVGGPQSASLLVSVENCVQDFSIDRWRLTLPSASASRT